jgi:hypothetical protein
MQHGQRFAYYPGRTNRLLTAAAYLIEKYGGGVIWPTQEIAGSVLISQPAGYEGVITGCALANPSPVGYCHYFDGINDVSALYTSRLASLFNPNEGTLACLVKLDSGVWSDTVTRYIYSLGYNNDNRFNIYKSSGVNSLSFYARIGGAIVSRSISLATYDWFLIACTYSDISGLFIGYIDGVEVFNVAYPTGYIGTLSNSYSSLGGLFPSTLTNPFRGWIGYPLYLRGVLSPADLAYYTIQVGV